MPSKTITVTNGDGSTRTITIPDRSRFAGVRNISRAVNALPLTDDTTSIQVTVAGHANISGIYTGSTVAGATWSQQGGNGTITASSFDATDGYQYLLEDADSDPQTLLNNGAGFTDRPWKAVIPSGITITGIAGTETLTVNRTAPVITSDRKGESRPLLSKLVGGAAAAYSLRDLNDKAGNNKVVRVRRASDNHERDFLAKEVSNGTLKNWVNTQVTAPLDIREIADSNSDGNNDGRVGNYLIAKAAYSLRSLGTRQATLAATGDTVARADGKYVCQVRRSSDDALKSFTADEITDGTLVSFVGSGFISNGVFANTGFETFTNASATGFSATNTSSTGFAISTITAGASGDEVTVTFDLDLVSGDPALSLRTGGGTGSGASNSIIYTSSGSYTSVFTATGSFDKLGFSEGSTSSEFTISNLKVTTKDGFVKTWYDQSVTTQAGDTATGNHAVQGTPANQPKIVNAGALMVDSGIAGLDFDGSNSSRFLVAPSVSDLAGSLSMFSTSVHDGGAGHSVSLSSATLNAKYFAIKEGGSTSVATPRNSTNVSVSASVSGNDRLTFAVTTGETSFGVGSLGGTLVTSTNDYGSDFDEGDLNQIAIGLLRTVSPTGYFDGRIREILVYTSDQTDNRTAIEANIGEAYSITGIPAYDDTVDGFVEAWYDQSGNGKDAVQAVSTEQPKIVNAGSLVDGGLLFEDNQRIDTTAKFTFASGTSVSVFAVNTMSDNQNGYLLRLSAYILWKNGTTRRHQVGTPNLPATAGSATIGTEELWTSIMNVNSSGGTGNFFTNGAISNTAANQDIGSGVVTNKTINIGGSSANSHWNGTINELILYTSDQSANRPAIDANIKNQYEIT